MIGLGEQFGGLYRLVLDSSQIPSHNKISINHVDTDKFTIPTLPYGTLDLVMFPLKDLFICLNCIPL